MALRDAFVNIAQRTAIEAATRVVSSTAQQVAAGLRGNNPSNNTAPLNGGAGSTDLILSYPSDVSIDPMQGHYIMFGIRSQKPGKFKQNQTGSKDGTIAAAAKGLASQNNLSDFASKAGNLISQQLIQGLNRDTFINSREIMRENVKKDQSSRALSLSRKPYTELVQTIALYMPPQVSVSYEAKYADQEIGVLAEAGSKILKDIFAGKATLGSVASVAGNAAVDQAKQVGLAALDTLVPGAQGAKALVAIERGKIITPRMELMFEGLGRRSFSFDFTMIPKSESEAQTIREIVKAFKVHMTSNVGSKNIFGSENVRELDIPDVFDIKYMYRGQENLHLNKIGTARLTGMDVQYGGDRYIAFEPDASGSPPPQRTSISLKFTEIDIMYRDKIEEGY